MGYTIDTAATIRTLEAAEIQTEQASAIDGATFHFGLSELNSSPAGRNGSSH